MNEDYRKAVIDAIVAAGHTVTHGSRGLMIDDEPACVTWAFDPGWKVPGANGGVDVNYQSVWRGRKLPDDPAKAAALLIERHKATIAANAQTRAYDERRAARRTQQEALIAAFDVPNAAVEVGPGGAVFAFRVDSATPEFAAKLAAAIRGAL